MPCGAKLIAIPRFAKPILGGRHPGGLISVLPRALFRIKWTSRLLAAASPAFPQQRGCAGLLPGSPFWYWSLLRSVMAPAAARAAWRFQLKEMRAGQVLLATSAFSLELSGLRAAAAPKLTFALATAPRSAAQLTAIGLGSRRPFYTVDLPYLWGRLLESNGVIFGAGLVPPYVGTPSRFPLGDRSIKNAPRDLRYYDVRR